MIIPANKAFYQSLRQEIEAMPDGQTVQPIAPSAALPDIYVRQLEQYQRIIENLQNEKVDLNAKIMVLTNTIAELQGKNNSAEPIPASTNDEQRSFTVKQLVDYALSTVNYNEAKPIEVMLNKLCRGCDESVFALVDSIETFFRKQQQAIQVYAQPGSTANVACDQRESSFTMLPPNSFPTASQLNPAK